MSGPDIFVSYSREDRTAARHIAESFIKEGFSVWWDAALRTGQTFDEVIEKQLRSSKAVVVLWSPRSVASRWVRAEATLADRRNKLVPAIIEACDRPIIFELTHATDLSDWTGETSDSRWRNLVSDLRRLVDDGKDEALPLPVASEPVAKAAPAAPAVLPPAEHEVETAKPLSSDPDDLILAASRFGKKRGSDLLEPTAQEDDHTQFYKRSDEYRLNEGDKVHCLQKLDGKVPETRFVVTPAGLTIGRTAPADVVVPGAGVSRAHCLVELAGDKVRITDLNSTNGTYIDNKRIDRSVILGIGSILRVGAVSFEHEICTRAEIEGQADPLRLGLAADSPGARLARSS